MKYLLIDTNIYLNMAVNRRKELNNKLLAVFSKLLQYGEIRIVVPAIVRHETFKHLEEEILKVGNNLETTIKSLDGIYWVNGITEESFDINYYKKNAKQYLQNALEYFNKNKGIYVGKLEDQIDAILKSKYAIFINDNETLINKALKRKIYKKAPCHKKESYADAIIAEVLINLRDYVNLTDDDVIYFVSDNPEDFSKNNKECRNVLHPDIVADLEENAVKELVEYRLSFNKLIMKDLEEEIYNANVKEEFEKELAEKQAAEEADYYSNMEDLKRESAGLSTLSNFDDSIQEIIAESKEASEIVVLFEKINSLYEDLEETHMFYWDDLSGILNSYIYKENENALDEIEFISKFNDFLVENKERYYCYTIEDVVDWVGEQEDEVKFDTYDMRLPDYINLDDEIILTDVNRDRILLSWENTELSPESGEIHSVYYNAERVHSMELIAEGRVEITYGFIEFDDCGNVGDGCEEDIDIRIEPVIEVIKDVYGKLLKLRNKHQKHIDYIKTNLIK